MVKFVAPLALLGGMSAALTDVAQTADLCLVPVIDGQPTEADINSAWRIAAQVEMLAGIARPVIYPSNRAGVWTIDEKGAYLPFGGEFPANMIHDQFAQDVATGRVLGVNVFDGLFAIDPGQTQFRRIADAHGNTLDGPFGVTSVPRLGGVVVSDPNGLYLLDAALKLVLLPVRAPYQYTPGKTFDLPELGALLVNPNGQVFLRFDSGEAVLIATLEKWDFVVSARLDPVSQSIEVRTNWNKFSVEPPHRNADGTYAEPDGSREVRERSKPVAYDRNANRRIHAESLGFDLFWNRETGLWRSDDGGQLVAIPLPFDVSEDKITDFKEFSPMSLVVMLSGSGMFTLDKSGHVARVAAPIKAIEGASQLKGVVPIRNEMIFVGGDALYLLVAKSSPLSRRCTPGP